MNSSLGNNGSTYRWRKIRETILKRDGYQCAICGATATHVDHIVPRSKGGDDHELNLQALCEYHNLSKGDGSRKPPGVFSTRPQHRRPYLGFLSPTQRKPAETPFERPESA